MLISSLFQNDFVPSHATNEPTKQSNTHTNGVSTVSNTDNATHERAIDCDIEVFDSLKVKQPGTNKKNVKKAKKSPAPLPPSKINQQNGDGDKNSKQSSLHKVCNSKQQYRLSDSSDPTKNEDVENTPSTQSESQTLAELKKRRASETKSENSETQSSDNYTADKIYQFKGYPASDMIVGHSKKKACIIL